jgi:hypothetical protein
MAVSLKKFIGYSFVIVFLVSCVTETVSDNPGSITPQISRSQPNIATPKPNQKNTNLPDFLLIPTTTPNQTQTTVSNEVMATYSAIQTLVSQYPRICNDTYSAPRFSPDGLWMKEVCYSEENQDLVLALSNKENHTVWKFPYKDYSLQIVGIPYGGMDILHWSGDGRYVYFFSYLGGDGGECFYYYGPDRGSGLFRVDLQTGRTVTVFPPSDVNGWYGFSISPTDQHLVYGVKARDLNLLDMTTGRTIKVSSDERIDETGAYLWSDDGLNLVYSSLTRDSNGEIENYSLRLVDARTGSERTLLESPENCFVALSWDKKNILMIKKDYSESLIEFDLHTNTIVNEATLP